MIKKLYLPLVALLVLALSSCGKMGELSSDYFTTNPEVLEAIGGKVPVTINGCLLYTSPSPRDCS